MGDGQLSLGTVARTIGRVCYSEALTVGWSSVLFVLSALPLITVGASLLALMETWITVVSTETEGRNLSERERLRVFTSTWRENLLAGVPYSFALLLVVCGSLVYYVLGSVGGSGIFLLWTLVSLYFVVMVLGWELRAASVRMRSPAHDRPHFREAMERAAYSFLDNVGYSVLHLAWFAGILFLVRLLPPAFVMLGPALLVVSETVGFEELFGEGAETIRAAYAR
ncbi:MAG: hypothetical protein R3338_14185 [Thermoanaerobaculia bacterium]|nr:hypothetical protein [Thermoanaerobaculia bacterium]